MAQPPAKQLPTEEEILASVVAQELPWLQEDIDPVVLAEALAKKFDLEWVRWEPETLLTTIEKTFLVEVPRLVWEKILALRVIIMVDVFWEKWDVFEKVCCAFNSVQPTFDTIQYLSAGQIAYAIDCANQLRNNQFSNEVKSYIAAKLKDEGLVVAPKSLEFVQAQLTEITLEMDDLRKKVKSYNFSGKANDEDPVYVQKLIVVAVDQFVNYNKKKRQMELNQLKD